MGFSKVKYRPFLNGANKYSMILYNMSQINLASYKNIYLQTAKEYVENITKSFEKLNKNSKDVKAIEVLHISSHSLKSQSQVMGYNDIAKLSKSLEEFSNNALQTNKSLTVIGVLSSCEAKLTNSSFNLSTSFNLKFAS